MAKDLKVHIGRGVVNGGDLVDGELARESHAVGALLAAPDSSAVVVDVRLGRDMRLDAGHGALDFKEQAPVLMMKASAPSVEQRWMSCSASPISDCLMTMLTVT